MKTQKRKDWWPKKRVTAISLQKQGYSYRAVGAKIGCGVTALGVQKLWKRYGEKGTVETQPGRGRHKATTEATNSRVVRLSLNDRKMRAKKFNAVLADVGGSVSDRTVCQRLVRARFRRTDSSYSQNVAISVSESTSETVTMGKGAFLMDSGSIETVIWSDESRFSISGSDGAYYVKRQAGEECLPACLTPTMKHPLGVMVWGCMSWSGVGRLQVIDGIINSTEYTKDVLQPKLLPSARSLFIEGVLFLFQQDGAPCHTARICMKWLSDKGIEVLSWPGNSPDLNSIKNLWSRFKHPISAKHPSNRQHLIEAIISSCHHVITTENLQKLVESMPRQYQAAIRARGYLTRY